MAVSKQERGMEKKMSLRFGAGAHAGPFWVGASTSVHRRRSRRNRHVVATFWSWLVMTAVIMTVIHVSWVAYVAAGILVAIASYAGRAPQSHPKGRHR
jgi:hypothetical protein